jgi:hypothetical protein
VERIKEELSAIRSLLSREQPEQAALPETEPPAPDSGASEEEEQEGQTEESEGDGERTAGLMDYLAGLAEHLPEDVRERFESSEVRRKMDEIREKLSGGPSLLRKAERRRRRPVKEVELTSGRIAETFRFLRGLSTSFADQGAGSRLSKRLDSVIARMEDAGG